LRYSGATASDGAESARNTTPTGVQSDAGHTSTAFTDHAQELPYLPIDRSAGAVCWVSVTVIRHSRARSVSVLCTHDVITSPVLLYVCLVSGAAQCTRFDLFSQ